MIPRSRQEAKAFSEPLYLTGKACIRGHRTWRYTSTGACRACVKETSKEWEQDKVRYLGARDAIR